MISASWVARITEVSHQQLAKNSLISCPSENVYGAFSCPHDLCGNQSSQVRFWRY
jgi:hypothetical protein